MGMSIEEIIEIKHKYLDDKESTFEMESLFDSFISVMEKYQKIEEIVRNYGFDTSWICLKKIREVIENGHDNRTMCTATRDIR